jgi:hypothetical protein
MRRIPGREGSSVAWPVLVVSVLAALTACDRPDARRANATVASCVIGADAVGPVRLGAALVTVTRADTALMSLHALEDDADAPIDWSRAIVFIETFSPACRTAEGIGPGSLVVDVERTFGPTRRIVLSEIESREFIEFERQPAGMILRLDYSGDFAAGARETVRFAPGAKLLSIALARAP